MSGLIRNNIDIYKKIGTENNQKVKDNEKILDNFELNDLNYDKAYELDNRSFLKTYWSVLLREHLFFLTFVANNDYNLFYIKFNKFLILFCDDMALNCLFFVHESMHRKYTIGEDFTFVQKIPQLVFTIIVSNIMEVVLCFLSMTDVHYYEIKQFSNYKDNFKKVTNIFECIKRKLVTFFIFTFLLFLFYWYLISAF
jgi:hypothetical protein